MSPHIPYGGHLSLCSYLALLAKKTKQEENEKRDKGNKSSYSCDIRSKRLDIAMLLCVFFTLYFFLINLG